MHTAGPKRIEGFAVWITGLPASGKSTLARALASDLSQRGIEIEVLESDVLRTVFTPRPRYDEEERTIFYGAMAFTGGLLTRHGISVIFDATAHRRAYRDRARQQISRFIEVYVECPLSVCMARDPKGIYRKTKDGAATTVPGVQAEYEPPLHPEVSVRGDTESPESSVPKIIGKLKEMGFVEG